MREIGTRGGKNPGPLPDGLGLDVVEQVDYLAVGEAPQEHALHHPDVIAPTAEVGQNSDNAVHFSFLRNQEKELFSLACVF